MSDDTETIPTPGVTTRFKAKPKTVILDYRGTVGRGTVDKNALRNDRPVRHRLSPLMVCWPSNGQRDLQLQPGVNVVDAELWQFYSKTAKRDHGQTGHPEVQHMVKTKMIRKLDGLPDDPGAIQELIERSMDPDGLRWIEARAKEAEEQGEEWSEILDAVKARLARVRPVKLKPIAFQESVPLLKDGPAPQLVAMG